MYMCTFICTFKFICDRIWQNRPFRTKSTFELLADLVRKLENGRYRDYCTSTKFNPLRIFYSNPGFHARLYNTTQSVFLGSLEAFSVRERTAIKLSHVHYHDNANAVPAAAKSAMAESVAAALNSLRDSTLPVTDDLQEFITDFFGGTNDECDLGTRMVLNEYN